MEEPHKKVHLDGRIYGEGYKGITEYTASDTLPDLSDARSGVISFGKDSQGNPCIVTKTECELCERDFPVALVGGIPQHHMVNRQRVYCSEKEGQEFVQRLFLEHATLEPRKLLPSDLPEQEETEDGEDTWLGLIAGVVILLGMIAYFIYATWPR